MDFFKKKKPSEAIDLGTVDITADLEEAAVNYNTVLDYLVGLSPEDYQKVFDVAVVYREANTKASAILGVPDEPTTFITQPEMPEATPETDPDTFVDDELEAAFLADDPKPTKVPVKDETEA